MTTECQGASADILLGLRQMFRLFGESTRCSSDTLPDCHTFVSPTCDAFPAGAHAACKFIEIGQSLAAGSELSLRETQTVLIITSGHTLSIVDCTLVTLHITRSPSLYRVLPHDSPQKHPHTSQTRNAEAVGTGWPHQLGFPDTSLWITAAATTSPKQAEILSLESILVVGGDATKGEGVCIWHIRARSAWRRRRSR